MNPATPAGSLVGRDSEMALLAGLMKEAARGRGSSVLIEGEPGIGKSALVRAAVAHAPEIGCQVYWGARDELSQALPLLPFLDGLRVREPSANPRRTAVLRLLRREVTADRAADGPAVLAEQLLALVAELCAVQPVVLVIDDLQWADQEIAFGLAVRSAWLRRVMPLDITPGAGRGRGWPRVASRDESAVPQIDQVFRRDILFSQLFRKLPDRFTRRARLAIQPATPLRFAVEK